VRRITIITIGVLVALAACADGTGTTMTQNGAVANDATTTVPKETSPVITVVSPPTTYVAHITGEYSGRIEENDELSGAISFSLRDVGSGDTLADGQIIDVDYQVVDLRITLTMADFVCGATAVADETELFLPGPFPVDLFDFEAQGPNFAVEGTFGFGRSVSGTVTGTVHVENAVCQLESVPWSGP